MGCLWCSLDVVGALWCINEIMSVVGLLGVYLVSRGPIIDMPVISHNAIIMYHNASLVYNICGCALCLSLDGGLVGGWLAWHWCRGERWG